jgi:hypothetical protein
MYYSSVMILQCIHTSVILTANSNSAALNVNTSYIHLI